MAQSSKNCLNCNKEKIKYWVMNPSSKINKVCEGCKIRFQNIIDVSTTQKLKHQMEIWIRYIMKEIIIISQRIFNFKNNWIEKLKEFEKSEGNENYEIHFYDSYAEFLQLKSKIKKALLNLNNELNNNNFPQSDLQSNYSENDLKKCKNLLQKKEIFQAQKKLLALDTYDAKYFQIECLILQKNLDEAYKQSEQIINETKIDQVKKINKEQKFNLLLQKAKICHKKGLFLQALHMLNQIIREGVQNQNDTDRVQLQIAKTFMKCGNFDLGFSRLETLEKEKEKDKQSKENKYECYNYPFSLTYAKALQLQPEIHPDQDYFSNDESVQSDNRRESQVLNQSQIQNQNQNYNYGSGIMEKKEKKYQEIKKIYDEILQEDPSDQKALYGLSQIYIKLEEYSLAQDVLYELYQLNPSYKKQKSDCYIANKKWKQNMNKLINNIVGALDVFQIVQQKQDIESNEYYYHLKQNIISLYLQY
ncbi:unnamed protein product [Paramecium sonneborni]|uniref:Tetratricopeptide repeat protein n=1 Tax=Paramecium sonneborni TaxID=65129 RepID=A0A8S1PPB1_9CILI|nr:unnamed protein product [Paramecium sonneborni]